MRETMTIVIITIAAASGATWLSWWTTEKNIYPIGTGIMATLLGIVILGSYCFNKFVVCRRIRTNPE